MHICAKSPSVDDPADLEEYDHWDGQLLGNGVKRSHLRLIESRVGFTEADLAEFEPCQ